MRVHACNTQSNGRVPSFDRDNDFKLMKFLKGQKLVS